MVYRLLSLILLYNIFVGQCHSEAGLPDSPDVRKVIVVIDTAITPKTAAQPYMCTHIQSVRSTLKTSKTLWDSSKGEAADHGDNVVGLIGERIDQSKYCIVLIVGLTPYPVGNVPSYLNALKMALNIDNVVGINLSLSSSNLLLSYSHPEFMYLSELVKKGVHIVTAAGNLGLELKKKCFVFPACLRPYLPAPELMTVVSSEYVVCPPGAECRRVLYPNSNWSNEIPTVREIGLDVGSPPKTGTSQAAAIRMGRIFSKEGVSDAR